MSNTQVFLAQSDDGIPLEGDGRVGSLNLKLLDELVEITVTVIAKELGAQIFQLILALDVVDAGLALPH